eukprot:3416235-Pyramimonas_sp.AAC.1
MGDTAISQTAGAVASQIMLFHRETSGMSSQMENVRRLSFLVKLLCTRVGPASSLVSEIWPPAGSGGSELNPEAEVVRLEFVRCGACSTGCRS